MIRHVIISVAYVFTALCLSGHGMNALYGQPAGMDFPASPDTLPAADSGALLRSLQKAWIQGHLEAHFFEQGTSGAAPADFLEKGPVYYWDTIHRGNVPVSVLGEAEVNLKGYTGVPVDLEKLRNDLEKIIIYHENNGYPFAEIALTDVSLQDHHFESTLKLTRHPYFAFDSIAVNGDIQIHPAYLQQYLGIKKGKPYDEDKIEAISGKIRNSGFMKEIRPVDLAFQPGRADVYAYLNKRAANRINAILGIIPGDETANLQLTGDVELFLINAFHRGESIDLNWRKLESSSQTLNTAFEYPFLFETPVGLGFNFDLYKQDSTYLSLDSKLEGRYHFAGNNFVSLFYHYKSSRLVSQNQRLNARDLSAAMYGIGWQYKNLDNVFNPSEGFVIRGHLSTGQKSFASGQQSLATSQQSLATSQQSLATGQQSFVTSQQSLATGQQSFVTSQQSFTTGQQSGDDENQKNPQTGAGAQITGYIPILRPLILKTEALYGGIYGNELFENEMHRLGGMNSIRGFDDHSIFASQYGILRLEWRYLFQEMSHLHIFWDGAYYEKKTGDNTVTDYPYSLGTGFTIRTNSGILSLSYATGSQFNNPLEPLNGKIHIGYLNRF